MGPGRFPKSSVPGKPHPLCLCFLTNVVVEQEQFLQNYRRGTYNSFFAARRAAGAYADAPDPLLQAYNRRMWGDMATGAARGAGMGAARFAGALVLTKLEESFFGGG